MRPVPALPPPRRRGRQLSEACRKRLVLVAVGMLRAGDPPSPFFREGLLRAAFRSAIVLGGGWCWRDADAAARAVVIEALRQLGAHRPAWAEASTPLHAQADAFTLVERTRCRTCGGRLPAQNRSFCSARCNHAWHAERRRAEDAANRAMLAEAL